MSVCRLPNGRAYRVESACPGIFGVINLTLLNENLCVCLSSVWSVCLSAAAAFAKQFLMHKTFLSAALTVAREKQVSLTLVHRSRPGQKLWNKNAAT